MYLRLDSHTEKRLIALGKKRFWKVLILTVAWIIAVIVLWRLYLITYNRRIIHPTNFAFPLFLILPFFPFHAHRIIFGKTFYGRVMSAKYRKKRKLVQLNLADMRDADYLTADVVFVGRNGESVTINYKLQSILAKNIYYKPDDYILFIRGLSYPVKYPIPENEEYICPVCGNFIKAGKRRCGWCRADFS